MGIIITFLLVCFVPSYKYVHAGSPSIIKDTNEGLCDPYQQRIITIGDIHGDYTALQNILKYTDAYVSKTIISIGDVIDRGDDTIKILDFLMNQNKIIHLKGNHEEANLQGNFNYVSLGDINSFGSLWNRRKAFSWGGKYFNYLSTRKIIHKEGDVIFVHAGISFEIAQKYKTIEEMNEKFKYNYDLQNPQGPIWYRAYSNPNQAICKLLYQTLDILDAKFMVMGHITFQEISTKCEGKAIFIDTGISYALRNNYSALEIIQESGKTIEINALYPNKTVKIY